MRATQLLFVLATVAVMVNATIDRTCPSQPSTNPFAPSTCTGYLACEALLCVCAGGNATTGVDAATCLTTTVASCDNLKTCFAAYFTCLSALASVRGDNSDSCAGFGATIHQAQLADSGDFTGSTLQQSCQYNLCSIANSSSMAWSCASLFESGSTNVCNNATANGTPAPTLQPSTAAPTSYAFAVTLRLSGNNWGPILSNPTLYNQLVTSLIADLAGLLGIDIKYIDILSLTQGSLNVDFAVLDGSSVTAAALTTASAAAMASSTWLSNTVSLYHQTNPNESLTATLVNAGPGPSAPSPPSPGGNSPSAASATSAVIAAAAAMVAVLAMQ